MANQIAHQPEGNEFEEKVIQISRVSKKTKGGNKVGFSVLMVVGDRKGRVGVGLGKAGDVVSSIKKGIRKAKKKMITVPLDGTTIPFMVRVKKGAGEVMLKPATKGSGVIAGGPVRAVVEAAGIRDISSKILGSDNQASSVYATFAALKHIEQLVKIKDIKLRSIAQIEEEEKKTIEKLQEQAKHTEEAHAEEKKAAPKKKTEKKSQVVKEAKKAPATTKKTVKTASQSTDKKERTSDKTEGKAAPTEKAPSK